MRVIKLSIDIIVEPLTVIINVSLVSGCFPDTLKIANFSLFKTGDPVISPSPFFQLSQNFMKTWFIIVSINTEQIIIFFRTISLDFLRQWR